MQEQEQEQEHCEGLHEEGYSRGFEWTERHSRLLLGTAWQLANDPDYYRCSACLSMCVSMEIVERLCGTIPLPVGKPDNKHEC